MGKTVKDRNSGRLLRIQPKFEIILDRVIRWIGFSVAVASVPIGFAYLSSGEKPLEFLSRGDLYILSSALAAAAIGELLGPKHPRPWIRNLMLAVCALIVAAAIALYSAVAGKVTLQFTSEELSTFSWQLLIFTVVLGIFAMALTADDVLNERPAETSSARGEV